MGHEIPTFIVDDEPVILKTLGKLLELERYPVQTFLSAEDFLAAVPSDSKHILIVDKNLPGLSGIELISRQREAGQTFESILITGYAEMESAIQAVRLGCYSYLKKPFDFDALLKDVSGAAQRLSGQGEGMRPSSLGLLQQLVGPLSATSMQFASLRRALEVVKLPADTEESFDVACATLRGIERLLEEHLIEARLTLGSATVAVQPVSLVETARAVAEELNNLPYWEKRALIWVSNEDVRVLADPPLLQALLTCLLELAFDDSNTTEPILIDVDVTPGAVTLHLVVQASLGQSRERYAQNRVMLCQRMATAMKGRVNIEPYCGTLGVDYSVMLLRDPADALTEAVEQSEAPA